MTLAPARIETGPSGSLVRPQSVVLVLAALAPYDGLLLLAGLPRFVDAWKEALVAFAFGLAILERPSRRAPGPWPSWALPLLALVGWSVLSFLLHPSIQSLVGLKIGYLFLLLFVVLRWSPLEGRDRDRLITVMMVNGFVTSVVGLAQQVVGHEALNRIGYEYDEVVRFAGSFLRSFSTFGQPFPFAYFVMVVILLCLPVALEDRRRLRNRVFLATLPVLLLGMSSAVVRGAFLGLAVGALYLGMVRYRVLAHALLPLPLVMTGVLLSGAGVAMFSASSLEQRVTGWVDELGGESIEPLGTGIGSTGAAAELIEVGLSDRASEMLSDQGSPRRYQPDNQYVKTLIELGPIGLWLLLWVLMTAAVGAHRTLRAATDHATIGMAAGITASTVAAIGAATVATYWEIFPADLYFWLLLGVLPSLRNPSS